MKQLRRGLGEVEGDVGGQRFIQGKSDGVLEVRTNEQCRKKRRKPLEFKRERNKVRSTG